MKREQIIQMARDAGLEEMWDLTPRFIGLLERFAVAIRAATKEEDADLCDDINFAFENEAAGMCANRIRASK